MDASLHHMDQQPLGITAEVLRAVEECDLELDEVRPPAPKQHLRRITARHHALAKCLASGMRNWEAAEATGYAPVTISILKSDPTFCELIKAYEEKTEIAAERLHERLIGLSIDAHDILRDRLEETPEKFGHGMLMEMIRLGADRTGHGPSNGTVTNINVGLADRLEAARGRILNLKAIKEIPNGTD